METLYSQRGCGGEKSFAFPIVPDDRLFESCFLERWKKLIMSDTLETTEPGGSLNHLKVSWQTIEE